MSTPDDEFGRIFGDPRGNPAKLDQKYDDPFNSPEYQAFVESMVPHCHCADRYRPCDGVLAGGLCDNMQDDERDEDERDDDDPDYDAPLENHERNDEHSKLL